MADYHKLKDLEHGLIVGARERQSTIFLRQRRNLDVNAQLSQKSLLNTNILVNYENSDRCAVKNLKKRKKKKTYH